MSKAGDEHLGAWIYCKQHLRPHTTGWCTVDPSDKIPLDSTNWEDALKECVTKGFKIYNYDVL